MVVFLLKNDDFYNKQVAAGGAGCAHDACHRCELLCYTENDGVYTKRDGCCAENRGLFTD